MNYTLSESVTAYAADHYGPAIALALDEPKERNDRRHLCIRERRLAEAPPADAANARASLQPTSNDRTSPILLSETFWLTEINPPPETAITRQTTIRLAVAPRERFAFSVSLALGSGTFESADIYNGKRCVGQGHIIELFRNPKNYLQISRERSDIWLSPMLGMKLLFVLCSRLLIEDLVECGNIFSVTGRKTNSREPSVVPREAFGVTLKALPNLELLQDTDGGYIDLKNNSVRVEGNCWNNVTIRFNAQQARKDSKPFQVANWVKMITRRMLADPKSPVGPREFFDSVAIVGQYCSYEVFMEAWIEAIGETSKKDPAHPWVARRHT